MKLFSAVLLVSLACAAQAWKYIGHEYDRTPIGDSIDKATLKLLKEAYDSDVEKNVITSPLGVMLLLSMYSAGAGAGARQEISEILGGGDYKQLSESYSEISRRFDDMDDSYLTLANKVYVANQYSLNDGFANTARTYRSEVDKIDFTNAVEAADIINAWSANKTKGHIKTPVSANDLDADTVAALVNVIFFQGHWHVPFDAKKTKDEDFHVDKDTIVKKPTMKLKQNLFYYESEQLGAKLLELPYKEEGFRMVIVLPNEIDGLPSVLEKAAQKGLLEDVFKLSPSVTDVQVSLPKFEIKNRLDLNKLLPKIGIQKIFDEPASEVVDGGLVRVSKAFQEAFVKVDEEGATAGAFTGFTLDNRAGSFEYDRKEFMADHPFLYFIIHQDKILFAGTMTH